MTLEPGSRIGAHVVVAPLGAGGMGEVFRARDTQLNRDVALKVLPAAVADDPERVARFRREAQILASLNHPNIAAIYGLVEENGVVALALELVEGEDLAARLRRGALPVGEALLAGKQIAEALEEAHEHGVVHRDLKPGNIKLTKDGKVKVLDFGLAKALEDDAAGEDLSESPTLTVQRTAAGIILGTAAYMSPEQARGQAVDKRADIWAFGITLFEMLTGRRLFTGPTTTDTLAAVLTREVDWGLLPSATPPSVARVLHRCLERDARQRLHDIADARIEIQDALSATARAPGGPGRRTGVPAAWAWGLAAAIAVVLAVLFARRSAAPRAPSAPTWTRLAQVTTSEAVEGSPAWSPDGTQLAYVVEDAGLRAIVVRTLATGEERRLPAGGFDSLQPAWFPDGRTLVFVRAKEEGLKLEPGDVFGQFSEGDLWSFELASGRERRLVESAFNPSVSPDGARIAVDASWAGPRRLWILDAEGRNPAQASSDSSEAATHLRPRFSPDGRRLVFQRVEGTRFDVALVDLASKALALLTDDFVVDVQPVFSSAGDAVYFSSARGGGMNIWRVAVGPEGRAAGMLEQVTTGAGQDVEAAPAAGGRQLAFAILGQNADLWELPVSAETSQPTGSPRRLVSTTREDSRGAWSRDMQAIAFNSDRAGAMNIWIQTTATGVEKQLTSGEGGDFQPSWSPDGRWLAFFSSRGGTADIWRVAVEGGALTQLTRGAATEANPCVSPDGTRIAYQSDEGGRLEAWVMGADGSEPRRLTSSGVGGHFLRWSKDGRSVLFTAAGGGGRVMSVAVDGGEPVPFATVAGGSHVSLTPDHSRIVDVVGHKTLFVSPAKGGKPQQLFAFESAADRIDYPSLSPDGQRLIFDVFRPSGGDIWTLSTGPQGKAR